MKRVLIVSNFKDRYTGEMYVAGSIVEMTDERIREVKEVNPKLIEVVGKVKEPVATEESAVEVPAVEVPAVEVPEVEVPDAPKKKAAKK